MKGRKVVVTGGAGFIGSNLVWKLCTENDVTVVDDLSTGSLQNIRELIDGKKVNFIKQSITEVYRLKKVFDGADYVLHQAALPSVSRSIRDPLAVDEVNTKGTLSVLVAARDSGVKKVVFASSSSVYGNTPTLPKHEDMKTQPMSPYALTKLAGEHYCRIFTEAYGLKTVSLRYFNVYGPRQNPYSEYAAVIPRFIMCALNGEPMPIHGDGRQTRDFTFVEDVVRANILAAESSATGAYNIGGGRRISIMDLALKIAEAAGAKTKIVHMPPRPGDVRDSLADIARAKEHLAYSPSYTLEDGLRITLDWFKSNR
ncbi:MAG: SDR family oxidoreductase [Candidatus Methanosuratincola petrocarbonis]